MLNACSTIFVFAIALHLPAIVTAAEPKKIWSCTAQGSTEEDLHLVRWGDKSYIKLYEQRIWGNHYLEGEDLRWDFGVGVNNTARYSVVLKPTGELDYYDFTGVETDQAVTPSYSYGCRVAQG